MKYRIIIITAAVLCGTWAATAQNGKNGFPNFSLGIHTGMDIGGAAPVPPSSIGEGSKINATPYLTPALGVSGNMYFDCRWSLSAEVTYKKLGIDAKAWVTDQLFHDRDDPDKVLSFRGTANIDMKFSMLEVPVYAGYAFGRNYRNRAIAGMYYAHILDGKFKAVPKKGMLVNVNNPDDYAPVNPDEPMEEIFDKNLSKWDIGLMFGYETQVIDRLNLGIRLSVGVKDIFKRGENPLDYKMLHMRGSVVLSYKLFSF